MDAVEVGARSVTAGRVGVTSAAAANGTAVADSAAQAAISGRTRGILARTPARWRLHFGAVPLTYRTAGESHGPALFAVVEGLPAGLAAVPDDIDADLARRQLGYGRGGRMKIETRPRPGEERPAPRAHHRQPAHARDHRTSTSPTGRPTGWRSGSPTTRCEPITLPRPGHADLAGMLKYGTDDLRPILERASARETAARVAAGGVAKALLRRYGTEIRSHVVRIGPEAVPAARRPGRSPTSRASTRARCAASTRRPPRA